jgi:NADH dehydrogenase
VLRIDPVRKVVVTDGGEIPFDYAILASGSATNFFGNDAIAKVAFDLKDLPGALRLRNHLIRRFEAAIAAADPAERRAFLTIAIAGGGPTGVEVGGAVSELLRRLLRRDYPAIPASDVTVLLLEGGPRVLSMFPESLSRAAERSLAKLGVEVRTGTIVASYDGTTVRLRGGEAIPAGTLVWAAGVKASPLPGTLGVPLDRSGRVPVLPTLQMREFPHVFVVGDAAHLETPQGPVPALAPPAMQMGTTAAKNLARLVAGEPLKPFVYKDPGVMATIGRKARRRRDPRSEAHRLPRVAVLAVRPPHAARGVPEPRRRLRGLGVPVRVLPAGLPIILSIEEDALQNKVLDEPARRM